MRLPSWKAWLFDSMLVAVLGSPASAGIGKGILLGGNMAGLGGADSMQPKEQKHSLTGFVAGAFVRIGFGEMIAVEPQLLYHRAGSKYTYRPDGPIDPPNGVGWTESLTYLSAGVLGRVSLGMFSVFAGPTVGFLLGATQSLDPGDDIDIKDVMASTDPGLSLGVGLGFPVPPVGRLNLDFRYTFGFNSIVKPVSGQETPDARNSEVALIAGLAF